MQTSIVVAGPNHALQAVLTLLTFWACGGWALDMADRRLAIAAGFRW